MVCICPAVRAFPIMTEERHARLASIARTLHPQGTVREQHYRQVSQAASATPTCRQGERATDLLGRTTLLVLPPATWLLIWKGAECLLISRCSNSWMSCIPKTVSLLYGTAVSSSRPSLSSLKSKPFAWKMSFFSLRGFGPQTPMVGSDISCAA